MDRPVDLDALANVALGLDRRSEPLLAVVVRDAHDELTTLRAVARKVLAASRATHPVAQGVLLAEAIDLLPASALASSPANGEREGG